MKSRVIALLAVMALVLAACTGDVADTSTTAAPEEEPTTTAAAEPTTTAAAEETTTSAAAEAESPLVEFGEDPAAADPALVEEALGPVEPSDQASWDIVLASIARANQDLDQATIDKAMECWANQECDTGSGGELVMGYADGGGTVNVWRSVSRMEAILQALTYPEIGRIVSTAADSAGAETEMANIRFLIQAGVTSSSAIPTAGRVWHQRCPRPRPRVSTYVPFSAGWVGLPDQEGALIPGRTTCQWWAKTSVHSVRVFRSA